MDFEKKPEEKTTILDLAFINMMDELGSENEEVQKKATQGEGKKIIDQIVSIVEGDDMYKRADLRREINNLSDYQKGSILGLLLLEQGSHIDDVTRREIRRMLEV